MVTSTDERINGQMKIPAEDNKLCFISCAMSRISQLSAMINPILHNLGITPVRIDDMLMPGDNWIDISWTAIRKSKAAIVDISDSSSNVMLELGLIKSIKPKENVLVLCEKGVFVPDSLNDHPVLIYTFDISREKDMYHFEKELIKWGSKVYAIETTISDSSQKYHIFANAYRLLKKREYSACIVSACSELEYQISLRHKDLWTNDYGAKPQAFMLSQYIRGNFDCGSQNTTDLIKLRNKIVHEGYKASAKEASECLRIAEIINANDCKIK